MSDDSDDPVMALLATQRAVLAAVENLAGRVEAMQGKVDAMSVVLAQFVVGTSADTVPVTKSGSDRSITIGDRFRNATADEAAADPEMAAAQSHLAVMEAVIRRTLADNPEALERVRAEGREQLSKLLDEGKKIRPVPQRPDGRDRER